MPNLKHVDGQRILDITVGTIVVSKVVGDKEESLTSDECFKAIMELDNLSIKSREEALHYKAQLDRMF